MRDQEVPIGDIDVTSGKELGELQKAHPDEFSACYRTATAK